MSTGSRVLVALRVNATPERAFEAFTDQIASWWHPNGLFEFSNGRSGTLAFEPGLGGQLVETYEDGSTFTIGEIRAWEPPERLVLSWRQASFSPDQETELTVSFDEVADQTRVTVEHVGWDSIPPGHVARHGFPLPVFQRRFAEWWQDLLRSLADSVA